MERINLPRIIGYLFVIIGVVFIITNISIVSAIYLLSWACIPFYLFIVFGILSIVFHESKWVQSIQAVLLITCSVFALYSSFWNGYAIILILLTMLLMLSYGFYDKRAILKFICTLLALFLIFVVCSPEETLDGKVLNAFNVFIFVFFTLASVYILFKYSKVQTLLKYTKAREELESVQHKLHQYQSEYEHYKSYVDALLKLSEEEMIIIKELKNKIAAEEGG